MKIQFSTENAAFKSLDGNEVMDDIYKRKEVARILKRITAYVESGNDDGLIMDINGNKIGEWSI